MDFKTSARSRETSRLWKHNHREEVRAMKRAYYRRHQVELRAKDKQFRVDHPEEAKAKDRADYRKWIQTDRAKEIKRALNRKSHEEHRAYYAEAGRRRTARIKYNTPHLVSVDYSAIRTRDKSRCGICHKYVRITDQSFDHIIPLSKGGPHSADNIQLAHLRCNVKRGAGRTPAQTRLAL